MVGRGLVGGSRIFVGGSILVSPPHQSLRSGPPLLREDGELLVPESGVRGRESGVRGQGSVRRIRPILSPALPSFPSRGRPRLSVVGWFGAVRTSLGDLLRDPSPKLLPLPAAGPPCRRLPSGFDRFCNGPITSGGSRPAGILGVSSRKKPKCSLRFLPPAAPPTLA